MNHRHRSFNEEDDGYWETKQYYRSPFGRPYVDLYKVLEAQVDPTSQDDGISFPCLKASYWAFTDDMNIPSMMGVSVAKTRTCWHLYCYIVRVGTLPFLW